jgi:hypothetical protein
MTETPKQILCQHASEDAADGFIEWRKISKRPLTARAAGMISRTLGEVVACGGSADEALDLAAEHGWQTIKAEWYWNIKRSENRQLKMVNGGQNGRTNDNQNGRGNAAVEQIARLAGIGKAPGDDWS